MTYRGLSGGGGHHHGGGWGGGWWGPSPWGYPGWGWPGYPIQVVDTGAQTQAQQALQTAQQAIVTAQAAQAEAEPWYKKVPWWAWLVAAGGLVMLSRQGRKGNRRRSRRRNPYFSASAMRSYSTKRGSTITGDGTPSFYVHAENEPAAERLVRRIVTPSYFGDSNVTGMEVYPAVGEIGDRVGNRRRRNGGRRLYVGQSPVSHDWWVFDADVADAMVFGGPEAEGPDTVLVRVPVGRAGSRIHRIRAVMGPFHTKRAAVAAKQAV